MPAPFRELYAKSRKPGESYRIINRAITDDDRRRREARQRVEEIEERRRIERDREGDW